MCEAGKNTSSEPRWRGCSNHPGLDPSGPRPKPRPRPLRGDDVRENFSFKLRRAGLAVFEERLAETVLEALNHRVPDLILLDVGMPPGEISGIEVLARLREDPRWKRLRVVVLSGFGNHL